MGRTHRLSRNEPYWELWKRLRHKDILARQPQSRDSAIELPRAARGTLLDIVRGCRAFPGKLERVHHLRKLLAHQTTGYTFVITKMGVP